MFQGVSRRFKVMQTGFVLQMASIPHGNGTVPMDFMPRLYWKDVENKGRLEVSDDEDHPFSRLSGDV